MKRMKISVVITVLTLALIMAVSLMLVFAESATTPLSEVLYEFELEDIKLRLETVGLEPGQPSDLGVSSFSDARFETNEIIITNLEPTFEFSDSIFVPLDSVIP